MSDDQVVARRPQVDRFRDLLAGAIAEKIAAEPALLDRAREVMDGGVWRSDYESQWRALVAAGPAAVIGVLTSPHPDTLALKADSPFTMLGLVDDDERQRLLDLVSTRSLTRTGQPHEFEDRLLHLLERDATVRRCIERATRQTAEPSWRSCATCQTASSPTRSGASASTCPTRHVCSWTSASSPWPGGSGVACAVRSTRTSRGARSR